MRSQHLPGRTRWRLAEMLTEAGVEASPYNLWPAQGWWRSSPQSDVYRWEGVGVRDGLRVGLFSWDRMTDCVRHGVELVSDGPSQILVCPKGE